MDTDPIVIIGASRTPNGSFRGELSHMSAPELGTIAINGALQKASINPDKIDDVVMGLVLSAGIGQAPARQASLGAGIPLKCGATTINKMCGSGMKAAMFTHDSIRSGAHDIMVAGGMESMSNAPYLSKESRNGIRMGHSGLVDHMFLDGLEDAYDKGKLMGVFAENTAELLQLTRNMQDNYAIDSLDRAMKASKAGAFENEVQPIKLNFRGEQTTVSSDEQPRNANIEKIPSLKPAFKEGGTVTAANSSSISDGAAAMVITKLSIAEQLGVKPLATIVAHVTHAQEPEWFTTAPIGAIKKVLEKTNWGKDEVDLYEINEAFSVVVLAALKELDLDREKVNIHGGACAIGHPIGASGARIMVTLLNSLEKYSLKKGVASLCIGGGEATAVAIEKFH